MTGFPPPPLGDNGATVTAYLRDLLQATLEWSFEPIDEEDERVRCHDCGRTEGKIHKMGCDMERCPWCGGQLISGGCPHRMLRIRGDQELTRGQAKRFEKILNAKRRVPYVRWPVLCARCGSREPTLYSSRVGVAEWDRYVQMDMCEEWLCEPCYGRIKRLVDERSKT